MATLKKGLFSIGSKTVRVHKLFWETFECGLQLQQWLLPQESKVTVTAPGGIPTDYSYSFEFWRNYVAITVQNWALLN